LAAGHPVVALLLWIAALMPAAIKAWYMIRRQLDRRMITAAQALAVAVVFDLARALALLARGSHRARRAA
jgi:hypothetical protein